jgi:uncharacterized membrane protein YraQ (UPF0718 family)
MNEVLNYLIELFSQMLRTVGATLLHNWKILGFGILIAVTLKTYVNSDKLSKLMLKRKKVSILASVAFGAFTPLCACGTTAVIIGMMTTTLPWGPIMAFLTSSPLMSPDGFVLISGVISTKFAIALTIASIFIGITSGLITNVIEKRTNFLVGQSRFTSKEEAPSCACDKAEMKPTVNTTTTGCACNTRDEDKKATVVAAGCNCNSSENSNEPEVEAGCCGNLALAAEGVGGSLEITAGLQGNNVINQENEIQYKNKSTLPMLAKKYKLREFAEGLYTLGFKQILVFYSIFVAVGFMINYFIPSSIIALLFGADAFYAVPLASLIGLPLYITTDSGIPIIQSMLNSGASEGAMIAFMITGSATSAWVIAGLATFMKKRALMLYVLFVLVGGILSGYLLDFVNLFL